MEWGIRWLKMVARPELLEEADMQSPGYKSGVGTTSKRSPKNPSTVNK